MAANFELFKPLLCLKKLLSGRVLESLLKDSRFESHLMKNLFFKRSYHRSILLRIMNKHIHLQLYTIFINSYYIGYENIIQLSLQTVYY